MKTKLILIFLFLSHLCYANMASPIHEGTLSSSPITSRDIDILNEKIFVTIAKDFQSALYQIEYSITTQIEGKQIPLLFFAADYKDDFNIWVDGRETKLINIPKEYIRTSGTPFKSFEESFVQPANEDESETITIYWNEKSGNVYKLNDLKYFEIELDKGEHSIRVEYIAKVRTDRSGWIKEYSFNYSLSPAKNWKSFGGLEITVNSSNAAGTLKSNLGQPAKGKLDSVAVWNFDKIPQNNFLISFVPQINSFANTLISIEPFGLTLIFGVLLLLFHIAGIYFSRKSNPSKKYSFVVIIGSIIIPLLILIAYILSFGIIDDAIGPDAGRYHGYNFLIIFLYPLVMPVYWVIMWLADKAIKRSLLNI